MIKKTNLSKRRRNYPQQKRENIALFFEKSSKVKKLSAKVRINYTKKFNLYYDLI